MRDVLLTVMLLLARCSAPGSSETMASNSNLAAKPNAGNSRGLSKIDCTNLNSFDVAIVKEPVRFIELRYDGIPVETVAVPYQADSGVNGFSLNWAKKTKEGFEISIEYGSRMYFSKRLMFECRDSEFLLTKIHVESFDKTNPSKWTNKTISVRPPVSIRDFRILNYTNNT
jgi:hypothetical protein